MRVLSLFDGMSCGMIAFKQAGINIESYDAYEIDKYPIKVSSHNFPMIKQHGDVFVADFTQYEGVDWLIGGSPCTYWSIAQTNNRETTASGLGWDLFQQYVRALHEAKPKYFIYENNKSMSEAIRQSICEAFGFEQVLINSALVSAQNRNRYYWVGRRNENGTYSKVDVAQPEDRGILLKDILDDAVTWLDKSYTLDANYFKASNGTIPFSGHQSATRLMAAEPINITSDGKAQCIRATCYKDGIRNIVGNDIDRRTGVAVPINMTANNKAHTIKAQYYKNGIANFICNDGFDASAVAEFVRVEDADDKSKSKLPIYEVKDGMITIKDKQYPIKLADGYYIIRKLTVSECARLQTIPDWYDFSVVSNSAAYKMIGNGWTIEVIVHLIKSTLDNTK